MKTRALARLLSFLALAGAAQPAAGAEKGEASAAPAPRRSRAPNAARGGEDASRKHADEKEAARLEAFRAALAELGRSSNASTGPEHSARLAKAADVLRKGYPDSRPVLVEALQSDSALVRVFAVRILGEKGKGDEDVRLVSSALSDTSPKVRLAAVMAVRRLGGDGFRKVAEHLRREPERNVRKMGVETLEFWKSPDAVLCLVRLLENEKEPQVRKFIVDSLQTLTSRREIGDDLAAWRRAAEEWIDAQESEKLLDTLKNKNAKEGKEP